MSTRTRRLARSIATGLLAGAFGLTVPAASSADDSDSDRRSKRHWKHDGGHHGHHKHKQRQHRQVYHRDHHYGYAPSYAVHSHGPSCGHHYGPVYSEGFYCGPCSHHFASLHDLHSHVHHHHHVPAWRLPHVVIQASIGWVFGG